MGIQLVLACAELDLIFGSRTPNPGLANMLETIELAGDKSVAGSARAIHAASISIAEPNAAKTMATQIAGDERALILCERCLAAIIGNPALATQLRSVRELRLAVIESALAMPTTQQPGNESKKSSWMLKQSASLSDLNRQSESIVVLKELETKFPRNAGVQMQLGRAMSAHFGATDPKKPLAKWRRIAARLKPNTPNWYEAKYEAARLLVESGDSAAAMKLLKYIQAIPPGWDKSPWKPKFEQLLRKSEGKQSNK